MSSWAIAEVTSDIGLDMMKPLLSSANQKKSELQNRGQTTKRYGTSSLMLHITSAFTDPKTTQPLFFTGGNLQFLKLILIKTLHI